MPQVPSVLCKKEWKTGLNKNQIKHSSHQNKVRATGRPSERQKTERHKA